MKFAFVFALLFAVAFGQFQQLIIIDDFTVGANDQKAQVNIDSQNDFNGPGTLTATDTITDLTQCDRLLGCSRDMQMSVSQGFASRTFTSEILRIPPGGVFEAEWVVANPKNSQSVATLQYDGDDGAFNIPPTLSGLNSFDIEDNGQGEDLVFFVITDLVTNYAVKLYDSNGQVCQDDIAVQPTPDNYAYADTQIDIPLSQFTGCDKSDIGAIEFLLPSTDAVDAIVKRISVFGTPPTNSPTPSRTPTPTPTRTPAPTATSTPSRSNTPTPSRSGPCIFVCECPSFTCRLVYTDNYYFPSYSVGDFVYDDSDSSADVIYVPVPVPVPVDDDDGISTDFSSFTSLFTTFSTGFTTFFSTGFSSFTSLFTTFTSLYTSGFFSTFTSLFSSFTSFFTSFTSFNGSTTSDASAVVASLALVVIMAIV